MIGIGINGLTSVEGDNTDLNRRKQQRNGQRDAFYDQVWRCSVSRFVFSNLL